MFRFRLLLVVALGAALKCYKCKSSTDDFIPICDKVYWKQLDKDDWDTKIIAECGLNDSYYCLTQHQTLVNGTVVTERSCVGENDPSGNPYWSGCTFDNDNKTILCLCSADLCNSAPFGLNFHITAVALITGFLASSVLRLAVNLRHS